MPIVFFASDTVLVLGLIAGTAFLIAFGIAIFVGIRSLLRGRYIVSLIAFAVVFSMPTWAILDRAEGGRISEQYREIRILGDNDRRLPLVFSDYDSWFCDTLCLYLIGQNILEAVVVSNEGLVRRRGPVRHFRFTRSKACGRVTEITLKNDHCVQRTQIDALPDTFILLRIEDKATADQVPKELRDLGSSRAGSYYISADRIEKQSRTRVAYAFRHRRFTRQWIPFLAFVTLRPPHIQTVGAHETRSEALSKVMGWHNIDPPPHLRPAANDRIRNRILYFHPVYVFSRFWHRVTAKF